MSGKKALSSFPVASFIVALVCLFFFLGNAFIGGAVASRFHISQSEVRPSVMTTFVVTKHTLAHHPLFGIGPNRFDAAWNAYRPAAIIASNFSDTTFHSGVGFLLSTFATVGFIGGGLFFLFFGWFIIFGLRKIMNTKTDQITGYLLVSSFVTAVYLSLFIIIYNPGTVIWTTAFASMGIFISILIEKKVLPLAKLNFLTDPRKSFFTILAIVICLIGAIAFLYSAVQKYVALTYFNSGSRIALGGGDLQIAESKVLHALSLDDSDAYDRGLTTLYLADLNRMVASKGNDPAAKAAIQTLFTQAENAAQSAIKKDSQSSLNWITLGTLYAALASVSDDALYANAHAAYEHALVLAPDSPNVLLRLAGLEAGHKNFSNALEHLARISIQNPNYADALLLKARIEYAEGDYQAALADFEILAAFAPNNTQITAAVAELKAHLAAPAPKAKK